LWNLGDGKCTNVFSGFTDTIHYLKIMPNGDQVCLTKDRSLIKLWSFHGQGMIKCLRFLRGHADFVVCMVFSHLGDLIVSGSSDRTIKIWNFDDGTCLKTMEGHDSCVLCLEIMHSGEHLISGSRDFTIKIWCLIRGECIKTLGQQTNFNWISLVLIVSNDEILSCSGDQLNLWNVKNEKCIQTMDVFGVNTGISNIVLICQNEFICTARKNVIQIWSMKMNGHLVNEMKGHTNFVSHLLELPHGELLSGSWDRTIKIWDTKRGCCLKTLKGHTGWTSFLLKGN